MRIVIRADSSCLIGSGHLVRCLTLANELRSQDVEILFISREHPGNLIKYLEDSGYPVHRLPEASSSSNVISDGYAAWLGVSVEEDAKDTISILREKKTDWLIVDHYSLDIRWEQLIRPWVGGIFVIDDLANRDHNCELLLDQNYFSNATDTRYRYRVPDYCNCLLGPRYALLQPSYSVLHDALPALADTVTRVLVFFGASDLADHTSNVLAALSCSELAEVNVDIVIGVNYPDPTRIKASVAKRPRTVLHQNLPSLAGLMFRADLMLGAGGATTWERMCLGLPSIVTSIAENQRAFTEALAKDTFQVCLFENAPSVIDWRKAILQLFKETKQRQVLSSNAKSLVDGLGVKRVVNSILTAKSLSTNLCGAKFEDQSSPLQWYRIQNKGFIRYANQENNSALRISILCDQNTWLFRDIEDLYFTWIFQGYSINWVHSPIDLLPGDVCFILGCSQILQPEHLSQHRYNLVVHESDLPSGRGWSPMTWQILEGKNTICVTLFEASEDIDAGVIYAQKWIELNGTELISEWRDKQAAVTKALCTEWLDAFPGSANGYRLQSGEASYYPRRRPDDSELNIDETIRAQFNLLRVVDNERYPAFFRINGERYKLWIDKA